MKDKKDKKDSDNSNLSTISIKKIGRPKGSKNKKGKKGDLKKGKENKKENKKEILTLVPDIIQENNNNPKPIKEGYGAYSIDFAEKLNDRELSFLELHLTGKYTILKAMDKAGYVGLSNVYKYLLAQKIIKKYERSAGDYREIFRAVGLGEVYIALGILNLCKNAKSHHEKRDAFALAAKVLRLPAEAIQAGQGVTIVIQGQDQKVAIIGSQPGQSEIKEQPMPLSITK